MQVSCKIVHLAIFSALFSIGTLVLSGCGTCLQKDCKHESGNNVPFDINKIVEKKSVVPIAIIGAGPAGLTAAIYAAAQYDTVVIAGGAQASALTGSHRVENWPSLVDSGQAILAKIKEQALGRGARFIEQEVLDLKLDESPFEISLADGSKLYALAIIVSLGSTPRKLGIPGEQEFWGQGVSSCAICDAIFYKDKEVVVVGGGDSAIEEAVVLARFARTVTVIHRRDQLRASAAMQSQLSEYTKKLPDGAPAKVKLMLDAKLEQIIGDSNGVTGVIVHNNKTGQSATMAIDGVFSAIGRDPNTKLLQGKMQLNDQGFIVLGNQSPTGRAQETSISGVFAAGDIAELRPRYCQAIIAAGRGAQAAQDAINYLEEKGFSLQMARQLKEQTKDK